MIKLNQALLEKQQVPHQSEKAIISLHTLLDNVKANPGSIYMPLLSSFCMTLIQYIISGRNSTDSSLGVDKHCLKDSLTFRHLYRSGVFRG